MNTALLLQYGVPALIAIVSAVVGHWYGSKNKPSTPAPVKPADMLNHPAVQTFLAKLITAAQASQHSAMDAMIARLWPAGASAVTPIVNSVVDGIEAKIVK